MDGVEGPHVEQASPDAGLVGRHHDAVAPLRPACLLYTSDAAGERSSGELGGRRIIKKKNIKKKKQKTQTKTQNISQTMQDDGRTSTVNESVTE